MHFPNPSIYNCLNVYMCASIQWMESQMENQSRRRNYLIWDFWKGNQLLSSAMIRSEARNNDERVAEKKKNRLCGTNAIRMHYGFRWAPHFIYICYVFCVHTHVCLSHSYPCFDANKKVFSMDSYCKCFHFAYIYARRCTSIFFWLYLTFKLSSFELHIRFDESNTSCASLA